MTVANRRALPIIALLVLVVPSWLRAQEIPPCELCPTCEPCVFFSGSCCETPHGAGCNDSDCEACVCGKDDFCCAGAPSGCGGGDGFWDTTCADLARTECAAVCECPVDECGELTTDPCVVTVEKPPAAPKIYDNVQTALKAAPKGSTVHIEGRCTGGIDVSGKSNVTIEGRAPQSQDGCGGEGGLSPGDLSSVLIGGSGTGLKINSSKGVVIRFLNVVGAGSSGIELKNSSASAVSCNCVARNEEGIEIDGTSSSSVQDNLVRTNSTNGIRLTKASKPSKTTQVTGNTVTGNSDDGIALEEGATQNTVSDNEVRNNGDDGIDLRKVTKNVIGGNDVTGNSDAGIAIDASSKNGVDANTINGNGDGLTDTATCLPGSKKNTGSNVPPACQ